MSFIRLVSPLVVGILLVLVSGCDLLNEPADILFFAQAEAYQAGDEVEVVLENRSEFAIHHNICFSYLKLERYERVGWRQVSAQLGPEGGICVGLLIPLEAGGSARSVATFPDDLVAGSYRISTRVETKSSSGNSTSIRVTTDRFEIVE